MRSFLLASAALIAVSGIARAQSVPATPMAPAAPAVKTDHHHWAHYAAAAAGLVPVEAAPGDYLHTAAKAIEAHDAPLADDALSHAETRLLDRAVPAGGIAPDDSPAISAIEQARSALHARDFAAAATATQQALSAAQSSGD